MNRPFKYLLVSFLVILFSFNVVFAHESTNTNELIIHVDEKGFEPQESTVILGTKVIFENIGQEGH